MTEQNTSEDMTIEQAIKEMTIEQAIKEMHNWQMRYNEVAKVNNYHVEVIQGLIEFLQIQSGILFTAITGQPKCDKPLEKLSGLVLNESLYDLNFLRNNIIVFTSALIQDGDLTKAKAVWQDFINEGR